MLFLQIYFGVLFFVCGAIVGSFLNVVILRLPKHENIINSRSHCMSCSHILHWYDLFPVFSYLFSGGKCRYCKAKISSQYIIVELATALLYLAAYLCFGISPETFIAVALYTFLVLLSGFDIKYMEIPYFCSIAIAILGIISFFVSPMPWYEHLIGAVIIAVPFAIIAFFGGMGGGDVQLIAASGLLLGWAIIPAAFIGIIAGAVGGIIIKATGGKSDSSKFCFGPFLAFGIAIAYPFGNDIINLYLSALNI